MPLNLTTPIVINDSVTKITLTAITIDFEDRRVHIAYDEVNASDGTINRDKLVSVEGPGFNAFWTDFEAKSRPSKRRDLRRTAFEIIRDNAGRPGNIDDSAD